ncbi:hypothetical protein EYR40_001703 [Pleurotus pulmonarius]|nr:hypothetical protein EYR40_001703 [Pleurotus pulmonarius]
MSEYNEHRGEYPLSPPQPAYARSNDLDVVHEGMPSQRVSSRYNRLPPASHASVRSWVSTFPPNQQPPPPPPPPAAINLPSPVHEARGLSEHRSRPPTGFGTEDEYMNIDRHNVVQENGYGWTTQGVYPHPMEVVSPRISADGEIAPYPGRREKRGFVGGFFAGLLGRRGKGGGKRKQNEPMTPIGVGHGDAANLAAQSGATLPQYSSNPPTPVAPRAPTNIEYTVPIEMPIPEVAEPAPSEFMPRQSVTSQTPARRPSIRISITPASVVSSTSQARSQSDHTPSVHASTVRQDSVHRNAPTRHTQSDSDRFTSQREDADQGSPHSPNAVLADIQPTNDYRKMARPPPSTSTYSHIDRVQKFFRDLGRLPWIKHDRITLDYKPGIRGPDGDHRPRKTEERIVILNKPPVRWYYEDSPAAHSVDLLSAGEPSSSSRFSGSSRSRTVSSPRRRNSGDAPPTHRYTDDGYRSSPYDSARRSNGARRSQTPPRDFRQTDHGRSPPLSPPPVHHHRSRSPSLPSSPPDQRRHRSHTSASSTPPQRRQQHMNRHQHHHPPPVPQIPRHLQQPPQPPQFAVPAAIYAPTYIPYGHPSQHMTLASPIYAPHQPIFVMQSQTGSGSGGTPMPTAVRLNTPDPNNPQLPPPQPQQQQSPPPPGLFSGQAGQASPLYLSSLVPMPGYVLSDGVASPTTNLPGQYVYSHPQPGQQAG